MGRSNEPDMVVVTRSAYKKACESCSSGETSQKYIAPPWCTSGKLYARKKAKRAASPTWEMRSSYPLRENIWEYLHADKNFDYKRKNRKPFYKQTPEWNKRCGKTVILLAFLLITFGMTTILWISNVMTEANLVTYVIPKTKLISFLGLNPLSVNEECCARMKYLAAALMRAEETLRSTLRSRKTMLLTAQTTKSDTQNSIERGFIEGVTVSKGSETREWGSRVALWGVVPLWRAAPPPDTILAVRKPVPADCWPFSGSSGELIIDFPRKLVVRCISIEHVRPDTAHSAPKRFILYGVLENSTWIRTVDSEYRQNGPAKQFFTLLYKNIPLQRLVFRVLSNQGNSRYTCVYRVHLYESYVVI